MAHTFHDPDRFRDRWISVVNNWSTLNDIAEIARKQLSGEFNVEHVEVSERTAVLRLLEINKVPLFDTLDDHLPSPVVLTDMIGSMEWSVTENGKMMLEFA